MGFYATDVLDAVLEPHRENVPPPSKNRVWNFFTTSETCTGFFESQPVESHQEKWPTPTTTASGVRYYGYRYYQPEVGRWASRDPLEEMGSQILMPGNRLHLMERKLQMLLERVKTIIATFNAKGSADEADFLQVQKSLGEQKLLLLSDIQDVERDLGFNLFLFCGNNPANVIDRDGCQISPPVLILIGGIILAGISIWEVWHTWEATDKAECKLKDFTKNYNTNNWDPDGLPPGF